MLGALFLGLMGLANYYIGLKLLIYGQLLFPALNTTVYWVIFWIIALSMFLGRFSPKIIPHFITNTLNIIGSFWLVILCNAILFFLFTDLITIIFSHLSSYGLIKFEVATFYLYWVTLIIILFTATILFGIYHAGKVKINSYTVTIPKKSSLQKLKIVFLSDTHLGNTINHKRLRGIVDKINSLNPDLVIFGGDIIDDTIGPFIKQNMAKTLRKIKSRYGVYAVLGNHDGNYKGQTSVVENLEKAGMKVLLDEYVQIENSFYLAGRMDTNMPRGGPKRKPLAEILKGIDPSLPVIVVDHNPAKFKEAKQHNVDLQLSGHTHAGQFFPISFITKRLFVTHWGYLKKGNTHLIVTSGAATWGPPLRIGSNSEIVKVNIEFRK